MATQPDGSELPRPIAEYARSRVDFDDFGGLPLPFGHLIVNDDGDRLSNPLRGGVVDVHGEWMVVQESDTGFPVALRTRAKDAAVAATLSTRGDNQRFWNALLGYDADVGTFALAELRGPHRESWLQQFHWPDPEGTLVDHIQKPGSEHPFVWELDRENYGHYTRLLCCRVTPHRPWKVLQRCGLNGFRTLRTRYETAAESIDLLFNPVPPNERGRDDDVNGRDPEKGRELQELYIEMFSSASPVQSEAADE